MQRNQYDLGEEAVLRFQLPPEESASLQLAQWVDNTVARASVGFSPYSFLIIIIKNRVDRYFLFGHCSSDKQTLTLNCAPVPCVVAQFQCWMYRGMKQLFKLLKS